jgi:hypothetical protein
MKSTPATSKQPSQPAESLGTEEASASSHDLPEGGKILPPNSPVDVPRMPAPAATPAVVPDLSDPHGNTTSWADSTNADPHKKSVRTSINNG